jgi:hypothetical protein
LKVKALHSRPGGWIPVYNHDNKIIITTSNNTTTTTLFRAVRREKKAALPYGRGIKKGEGWRRNSMFGKELDKMRCQ